MGFGKPKYSSLNLWEAMRLYPNFLLEVGYEKMRCNLLLDSVKKKKKQGLQAGMLL